jgi:hypothetical protein
MSVVVDQSEVKIAASALGCKESEIPQQAPVRLYKAEPNGKWNYTGIYGILIIHFSLENKSVSLKLVDLNVINKSN